MRGLLHTTFLAGPLQQADISFVMEENGRPFLSHQPHLPLIPASNAKLFISAAALLTEKTRELFPALETYSQGTLENGLLNGDLIIDSCGSLIFSARFPAGDSFEKKQSLLAEQVKNYADQLKNAGIKEISGDVKLSFERWNAAAENAHYTAAAAFSFNENTVDTLVKDQKLQTVPEEPGVFKFAENSQIKDQDKVENNLIRYNPAAASRDYWRISHASATDYALSMLRKGLRANGIKISLKKPAQPQTPGKLLFRSESIANISEFIKPLNKHSDNFRAELLALLLNRLESGKASYTDLNKSIRNIFSRQKLSLESLSLKDGSGLSRKNKVSAADVNKLLKRMINDKSFVDSLSTAGKSGTLKKRFKGTVWEGCFHGKTGTLDSVSSLSGYWLRKQKPPLTFSFIGNNAENELFWDALEKFAASLDFML